MSVLRPIPKETSPNNENNVQPQTSVLIQINNPDASSLQC